MRQCRHRHITALVLAAIALVGSLIDCVHACTVLELNSKTGVAANVLRLFHTLPIFDGNNGTFFVDQQDFNFKCKQARGFFQPLS